MIDTHTHLNDDKLFPDRQKHMQNFIDAWWTALVNVAVNAERAERAIHIARTSLSQFPDTIILSTVGIHPSEACFAEVTHANLDESISTIKKIYLNNTDIICAIGECGIDLHYPGAHDTIEVQKDLLARQCQIAQEYWLPIVIHSRDGFQETIDVLSNFSWLKMVLHCFWYGKTEAEYLLANFPNVYFWFDGNITYPKAEALREACLITPIDKILLETDAPYLAPQGLRWTTNTPANVKFVYEFVAELKWVEYSEFEKIIDENGRKFYNS
jgi:TatD DNase family protein